MAHLDNATCSCPHLPNEIWSRIAWYIPDLESEPQWRPWREYRTLSTSFKREIENFYIAYFLRSMSIHVDLGRFYPEDCPELDFKMDLWGRFTFAGFEGEDRRIAVLRDRQAEMHSKIYQLFKVSI